MKKKALFALAATGIIALVVKKFTKKSSPVIAPQTPPRKHHLTNAFSKAKEVAVNHQEA